MLSENVFINIATNYCYMYNCHKIYNDLLKCANENDGSIREFYKYLVRYFGRIISYSNTTFVGELNQNAHYRLINDINKNLFLQVKTRQKYGGSDDIYVTFFCM